MHSQATVRSGAPQVAASAAIALLLTACATSGSSDDGRISRPNEYAGYSEPIYDGYERSSFYVEVRDGARLAMDLFRPTQDGEVANEPLPVVWMHTPYNRRTFRGQPAAEAYPGYALRLVPYGYNVAVVDFRGLYASFGSNVAYNRGEWVDAARWDSYDVTEWLADQPWSNGNIGMWGCSATGGSQMQTLTTHPPSLRAVVPMSAEFDAYPFVAMGGVTRRANVAPPGQSGSNAASAMRDRTAVPVDGPDGEALLAAAIAEHADNIESVGYVPFYDSASPTTGLTWWVKSSPATYLEEMQGAEIGVLSVANWDEGGTKHGPFFTFNNLNPDYTKLLVGPATHCDWTTVRDETGFDLVTEELRFFDYWLKGIDNDVMEEPAVTYYTYNAPEDDAWRTSETWPPENARAQSFYLWDGELTTGRTRLQGRDEASIGGAGESTTVQIQGAEGGLVYETEPLRAPLEVTGHPEMRLWIETAAGDVDVTAVLEDVAPDGTTQTYQMIGRLRASHRALAEPPFDYLGLPWMTHREADAAPVPSGEPVELRFEMLPISYVFPEEHRIRLRLTFADPQEREDSTLSVDVLRGSPTPSALILPLMPAN